MEREIRETCLRARAATRALALAPRAKKDAWLARLARALVSSTEQVLAANARDLEASTASAALKDRLALDARRLDAIAEGAREIASLPDPVGEVIAEYTRPNGLRVRRVRAPLGVVAMVYEARPNVTVEAAALCIKAGNAVILRGGTEAAHTNSALLEILARTLAEEGLPSAAAQGLPDLSRDAIRVLLQQEGLVDLAIPRGGEALVRFVTEHARVPVVQHYKGVCHLFVDEGADPDAARRIVMDAKLSRPGVCNALECLLVHEKERARILEPLSRALAGAGCEVRTDEAAFGVEFLDEILAVRVVSGLDEALEHVARYGSGHTEAIVTPSAENAERWRREVTRLASWSTPPPGSTTAASSAWAPRSASRRAGCTGEVPWASSP